MVEYYLFENLLRFHKVKKFSTKVNSFRRLEAIESFGIIKFLKQTFIICELETTKTSFRFLKAIFENKNIESIIIINHLR